MKKGVRIGETPPPWAWPWSLILVTMVPYQCWESGFQRETFILWWGDDRPLTVAFCPFP